MGQTSFILSIAKNAAVDFAKSVGIFSLELTKMQVLMRLISIESEINTEKLFKGELRDDELQLMKKKNGKSNESSYFH